MNKEHMEAGSERDKRQDFTIIMSLEVDNDQVQAQKLGSGNLGS